MPKLLIFFQMWIFHLGGLLCWGYAYCLRGPCPVFMVFINRSASVMYNVLSGIAACGRLGVAARPACLFVTRSGTPPAARDQRHASHVGATPAD